MSKHTPTPSSLRGVLGPIIKATVDGMSEETRATAAFIVRACNAHEDLVEALENIAAGIPSYPVDYRNLARAALATARGAGSEDD